MKKLLSSAISTCALLICGSSFGFTVPPILHGIYGAANIGFAKIREYQRVGRNDNTDGIAWNVIGGYQFYRYLATEIGYTQYPDESFGAGTTTGDHNNSTHLALVGIYPWTDTVSFFAKFGPAYMHHKLSNAGRNSGSHNRVVMYGGAGIATKIWNNLSLDVQVIGTNRSSKIPATTTGLVGLSYMLA